MTNMAGMRAALGAIVLSASLALAGALGGPAAAGDGLQGAWLSERSDGTTHTFVFDGEGGLDWTRQSAGRTPEFWPLIYRLEGADIDVFGFVEGPLKGQTLYGVIAVEPGVSLQIDFEPGPQGDDGARPAGLTDEAWSFKPVR